MTIITYCPEPLIEQYRELLRFLDARYPLLPREHFSSLTELGMRLQRPRSHPQVLVLLAPDRQYLERLASLKLEVQGNDLVLILPDNQDATQTLGHSLRPRLLTSLDEDIRVVEEVLARIINRALSPGQEEKQDRGKASATEAA